jgi:hypothetical protein
MRMVEMEARFKALENQVRSQEIRLRALEDTEAINRLQRAYGYYLEHWMAQEIIDLFSDGPDVALTLAAGTYLGKSGVKKYFERTKPNSEFLHQVMQLSGIVDVSPDGKTAKGRWYGFGAIALPVSNGIKQSFMSGIYICEYVKEDAVWRFKKLQFDQFYNATPVEGWVKPERLAAVDIRQPSQLLEADIPRSYNPRYPSGYIVPFHFTHPVTRKSTSEGQRNSSLENKRSES